MKQLVIRGNRVVAHGEDCFLCMGGTVICTKTGRAFDNATVANITGAIPADIDSVGYEYHAGEFVPCAPFGKGSGTIPVLCSNDCKSIKDSGISIDGFTRKAVTSYIGTGKNGSSNKNSLTFDFPPQIVFISPEEPTFTTNTTDFWGVLQRGAEGGSGAGFVVEMTHQTDTPEVKTIVPTFSGNTVEWSSTQSSKHQMNNKKTYYVIALG